MGERFGGPRPDNVLASELGGIALGIREKCVADPIHLGKELLGKDFSDPGCPLYRKAADRMVSQKDLLLIMPRNHGKTTLVDEVGTIWQLIKYPNDRILFAQASLDNAKALSRQVRQNFMQNERLRGVFPEYAMKTADEEGNVMSFSVPCRTAITREASVEIGTPDTNLAGRHYDVVKCSDIVNEQTVPPPAGMGSPEVMTKATNWYGTTSVLLDTTNPRSHRTVDGTRWHDADLYGKLLKTDLGASFLKLVVGIQTGPDGKPVSIWNKMNQEALIRIRSGMSEYLWAANMMNDPLPADGICTFKRDWFRTYTEIPKNLSVAITVDPAFSDQQKNPNADRSAIVVSGISDDDDGNLYVLAYRVGRWTPRALLDNLHELIDTWEPSWVGIEEAGQQHALITMFYEDQSRTGRYVNFRPLKTYGKNKAVRAMSIMGHAERYGIWVRPEHSELVDEFCRFPVGEHDDLVDALAYRGQDLRRNAKYIEQVLTRLESAPVTPPLTGADLIKYIDDPEENELWFQKLGL